MEKTIIKCECGTHLLEVSFDNEDNTMYLAMFYYGQYGHTDSFWKRVKSIFYYLRTGKYYSDQLVLGPEEQVKLKEFLDIYIKNGK